MRDPGTGCAAKYDTDEALRLSLLAKEAFKQFSMNLREFTSNYSGLLSKLPAESLAKELYQSKILGIKWDTTSDKLRFQMRMQIAGRVTRRAVLAATSSIYDPLGLVSPLLLRVKHFGQQLWNGDLDWDDYVGTELEEEWHRLATEVHGICVVIPRHTLYYSEGIRRLFHLICFVDASNIAMCCVAYVKTEYWNQMVDYKREDETHRQGFCRIQTGKIRLMPKDLVDTPRQELVAMFMGSNLCEFLVKKFDKKFESVTLFSDSTIAMAQVKKGADKKLFVHNRVRHINKVLSSIAANLRVEVRHVATEENPADIGTRGLKAKEVLYSRWWKGPRWMKKDVREWPTSTANFEIEPPEDILEEAATSEENRSGIQDETLAIATYTLGKKVDKKPGAKVSAKVRESNFVSYDKDIRSFEELITRFREKLQNPVVFDTFKDYCKEVSDPYKFTLTPLVDLEAIMEAERFIIREHQRCCGITARSQYPYHILDQNGIIRLRGRVMDRQMETDGTYPILLHKDCRLPVLLAMKAHLDCGHGGRQATMIKFWESYTCQKGMTTIIQKAIRSCFECRRWAARAYNYPDPPMLPIERVEVSKPFQYIGLDYAGPFKVNNDHDPTWNGSVCKVWVSLITCFVTRAIYLAVVHGLSNREFIHMFSEFVSKKGCPTMVLLDNQPSFESGGKLLKDLFAENASHASGDDSDSSTSTYQSVRSDITQASSVKSKGRSHFDHERDDYKKFAQVIMGSEVQSMFQKKRIRFQHITPLSPWKGAVYERLVGSFKMTLYKSAPQKEVLPYRIFQSLISHSESCVNNRPLSKPYPGFGYVTPRMLCEPFANKPAIMVNPFEEDLDYNGLKSHDEMRSYLKKVSEVQDRNWRIWKTNWLNELRNRKVVSGASTRAGKFEARVGDYCLMMDDLKARRFWSLGQITQLVFSPDGAVRAAFVKFKDPKTGKISVVERSVCRLCCMEIRDDEDPANFDISSAEIDIEEAEAAAEEREVDDNIDVVPQAPADQPSSSTPATAPKKKRGRSPKAKDKSIVAIASGIVKKGRGRPKKNGAGGAGQQ